MWAANSVLVLIVGFLIVTWMTSVKEDHKETRIKLSSKATREELREMKREVERALEEHKEDVNRFAHTHGTQGSSGEVIPR